jgi:hypothetical protein
MNLREQAHREAVTQPISKIADELQEVLGQKLTAYCAGLKDGRLIGKYSREEVAPTQETETRLRDLFIVVRLLRSREDALTVRAWMLGSHPLLEDRAPAELLHQENAGLVQRTANAEVRRSFQTVVGVAEAFVTG